ncbi:hypothetical protein M0R45_014779 [Rubus argutus]|uniref:Reverse transcriptase n=1 Tax=Rubus argutus TaxID=59490 RepID=A0AAW1XMF1_RUBAR
MDAKVSQPKKVRPPFSPVLRLSISRGGRRRSRGGTSGRSSSNGRERGKKLPPIEEESWSHQSWNDGTPWLVIGDFNELLWSFEKEGGAPWNPRRCHYLKNFVDSNNLLDIGYNGARFTWYRKEFGNFVIKERLDMGLINDDWLLLWPNSCITHLSLITSDHCRLLFNSSPILEKKKKSFEFESFWADDVECLPLVQQNWNTASLLPSQSLWHQNLSSCQTQLIKWSHEHFSKNRDLIKECLKELNSDLLGSSPNNERREDLSIQLGSLWSIEEKIWQQKSRISWLQSGDKNTRFFHLTTFHRRQRNQILKIANDSGTWIVGEKAIRLEFETHFQHVFTSTGPRDWGDSMSVITPLVSLEMNQNLMAPFTLEDVKTAAFQMGALKSPGPDGFPGPFYHKFWEVVQRVLFETSQDFRNGWASVPPPSLSLVLRNNGLPCPH